MKKLKTKTIRFNKFDVNSFEILNSVENKERLLKIKPLDYLKSLATERLEKGIITHKPINTLAFNIRIHNEWVTKEDVKELMEFINNETEAKTPWPMISSQMPLENTTIGIEAMHLIKIYKDTTFHYPSLCSTYYLCKPEDQNKLVLEYQEWWEEEQLK